MPANFADAYDSIQEARKATSLLMVEYLDSNDCPVGRTYATAFFVGKSTLLTAAHSVVVVPKELSKNIKIKIRLFNPGQVCHDMNEVRAGRPFTIVCRVLAYLSPSNLEKPYTTKNDMCQDIAILSAKPMESASVLKLSSESIPPGAIVDVIGYPGEQEIKWLLRNHENLRDKVNIKMRGEALLPPGSMVVTRGLTMEDTTGTSLTLYTNSTSPGLSGSCLVYNGKVCGINPC